jgi:FkbM family methyltransferase
MDKIVNSFVYQRILESGMPNSTIPAWLGETYSQAYEDVIMESLLLAYVKRNGTINGITYIEIGANHPVCTSSSYLLQRKYGAVGTLVEANPKLIPILQKHRPHDTIINAAVYDEDIGSIDFYISPDNEISSIDKRFVNAWKDGRVEEKISVPTVRINQLLETTADADVVFLSIDVEGLDMRLLADIDFDRFRPFMIQIEPSDAYAPGTSTTMMDFLKEKNYNLVAETFVNLIFQDATR